MADEDREQQFERALTRLLRDATPDAHHPDAETLAAYHEESLPAEEMSSLKEHIAGCVPCQEILALVEKSKDVLGEEWQGEQLPGAAFEQVPPIPRRTAASGLPGAQEPDRRATNNLGNVRSRPRWRWIAPLGAVAAATIVWVGFREAQTAHDKAQVQTARNVAVEPALTSPQPASPGTPASEPRAKQREEQNSATALKKNVPGPAGRSEAGQFDRRVAVPPAAEPAPAPVARDRASRMAARAQSAPAAAYANAPNAPAPAPPPPAVEGDAIAKESSAPAKQKAEVVQSQTAEVDAREEKSWSGANLLDAAAEDHRYIIAPGGKSAWRVGDVGKIEHSTNRGKSWKIEVSGVSIDLTSGSATSDKVAWVIGKSGMILRSTDGGKHWKQIPSPITDDLGGIHATDGQHATIWDVANRASFETSDGGASWTPVGKP